VIRTQGNPFRSRPSGILTLTSLGVVAVATALPYTPLGGWLGFVPVPRLFFLILSGMVVAYLAMVQVVKTWFYRRFASQRTLGSS
jgi:Mg2+-importing ATPase